MSSGESSVLMLNKFNYRIYGVILYGTSWLFVVRNKKSEYTIYKYNSADWLNIEKKGEQQ